MENLPANRTLRAAPVLPPVAPPRRGLPVDAQVGRFSPLNAPEREAIEAFCVEMLPWSLRQAKRSYRHLPDHLRDQAVDRTMLELRARGAGSMDRRALTDELARLLTDSLRHVHVGWCLNESSALLRRDLAPVPAEVPRQAIAAFVDSGLGGLERAVLQLEIGAGRDSRTTRAALRLGPREYARHREEGLCKLRDAVGAQVAGRVCDQHISSVVSAATGDRAAADGLGNGTGRCRSCAREAEGMRSVLLERLAVAPWPLAITPGGLLGAKLGVLGALFGKTAAGAGITTSIGSGATTAATVLTAAALATGTAAVVGNTETPREHAAGQRGLSHPAAPASRVATAAPGPAKATAAAAASSRRTAAGVTHKASRKGAAEHAAATLRATVRHHASPVAKAPSGTVAPAVAAAPATAPSAPVGGSAGGTSKTVHDTVTRVRDTVKHVTSQLPPTFAKPVDDTLQGAQDTVDQLTSTIDGLLKLKP